MDTARFTIKKRTLRYLQEWWNVIDTDLTKEFGRGDIIVSVHPSESIAERVCRILNQKDEEGPVVDD